MACESCYCLIFLEIMSFFPLKIFSSHAKLFVQRRLQFHLSHAENVSSKLPKWTLFAFYLFVHIHVSENVPFRFIIRQRTIAKRCSLPWFGWCFFSCWCSDPRCLAGVEVCRGENARKSTTGGLQPVKYSRQKLDRRYH